MKATTLQAKYQHLCRKNYIKNVWFFRCNTRFIRKINCKRHYGTNKARRILSDLNRRHISKTNKFLLMV